LSRKIYKKSQNSLQRRVEALKMLLSLERSTTKAKSFSEWENPPEVIAEDVEFKEYWSDPILKLSNGH
jgi:hypothetical protein